ncbi:MAG: hypothetical protein ACFFDF_11480 [Candidatus Odinarchaeota archaeon]
MATFLQWDIREPPRIGVIEMAALEAGNTNIFEWVTGSDLCVIVVGAEDLDEAIELIIKEFYFEGNMEEDWSLEKYIEEGYDDLDRVVDYLEEENNIPRENIHLELLIEYLRNHILNDILDYSPTLEEYWDFNLEKHLKEMDPAKKEEILEYLKFADD